MEKLKDFFSSENIELLYSVIQQDIKQELGKNLGQEHIPELQNIMKAVARPIPENKLKQVKDTNKFVNILNKQTLHQAYPLFVKIAKGGATSAQSAQR